MKLPRLTFRHYVLVVVGPIILLSFTAAFYSTNVAVSLALVATSVGLILATLTLKSATDNLVSATENLARNEILPRLSVTSSTWWEKEQSLTFAITNNGVGTAYGVKAFGTTSTGVRFAIESEARSPDLPVGEHWRYGVNLVPSAYREFKVDFEYADAKDYKYKQSIVIPKGENIVINR